MRLKENNIMAFEIKVHRNHVDVYFLDESWGILLGMGKCGIGQYMPHRVLNKLKL